MSKKLYNSKKFSDAGEYLTENRLRQPWIFSMTLRSDLKKILRDFLSSSLGYCSINRFLNFFLSHGFNSIEKNISELRNFKFNLEAMHSYCVKNFKIAYRMRCIHSIQIRTVISQRMLLTLLNQYKLVHGSFGQSNMHSTLDFCPRLAKKEWYFIPKLF